MQFYKIHINPHELPTNARPRVRVSMAKRPRFVLPGGDEAKSWDYLSQLIESAGDLPDFREGSYNNRQ